MSDVFTTPADLSSLRDKVVLITGGASGLGRATALAMAEAGAVVVIADIDEVGGVSVANTVGGSFVRTDVASFEANLSMVDYVVSRHGGLDFAYLNAGVSTGCSIGADFSVEKYRRAMGVNLDGVVFGTHACLGPMRARGGGAIVATASLAGLVGMPMDAIYTANKHGVVGFTRGVAPVLEADGIRVNAVCPGFAESAIVEPIREELVASGFEIIPAESVAATVVRLFALDVTGECWFVQPRREPAAFRFRRVPGPGDAA